MGGQEMRRSDTATHVVDVSQVGVRHYDKGQSLEIANAMR